MGLVHSFDVVVKQTGERGLVNGDMFVQQVLPDGTYQNTLFLKVLMEPEEGAQGGEIKLLGFNDVLWTAIPELEEADDEDEEDEDEEETELSHGPNATVNDLENLG